METTAIHLICTFLTFCTGGECRDYNPMSVNLRFQDGREFGEFWISPENALFPLPTLVNRPGEMSFDRYTHIYVPGGLNPPYMISLPEGFATATLTTHLPRLPDSGDSHASSAEGECQPVEDDT